MPREIDLDEFMLSPSAVLAWGEMARRVAQELSAIAQTRGQMLEIPDERARVNDNGSLTIYVKIPGVLDISMDVPADQWAYIQ